MGIPLVLSNWTALSMTLSCLYLVDSVKLINQSPLHSPSTPHRCYHGSECRGELGEQYWCKIEPPEMFCPCLDLVKHVTLYLLHNGNNCYRELENSIDGQGNAL